MRFDFSDHAIRRYIKRHAPTASWAEAHEALLHGSRSAVATKEQAKGGARFWAFPALGDVLAVGQLRQLGSEKVVSVITILPAMQHHEDDHLEQELARYIEEHKEHLTAVQQEEQTRRQDFRQREAAILEGRHRAEHSEEGQELRLSRERFAQEVQRLQLERKHQREAANIQVQTLELELRILQTHLKLILARKEERQRTQAKQEKRLAQALVGLGKALQYIRASQDVLAEIAALSPELYTFALDASTAPTRVSAITQHDLDCPDCGAKLRLRPSKYGLFYGCERYPDCRGTHGAHPDGRPLGIPAPAALREARKTAHQHFDQLWRGGLMTRTQAYAWLAEQMGLPAGEAHIGSFDLDQCARVVALVPSALSVGGGG